MRVEGDRQFLCGRGNAENLGNGILCSLSATGMGNLLRKEQCPSPGCCDSGSPHGRTFQQRTARERCAENDCFRLAVAVSRAISAGVIIGWNSYLQTLNRISYFMYANTPVRITWITALFA